MSLPVTPPSSAPIDEARAVDAAQTPASYLVTPPSLAPTPSAVAPAPPEPGLGEAAKIEARARLEAEKAKTHTLEKIAELGALVTRLTGQVKDLQDKVQTLSTGSEEKFACRIAFNRGLIHSWCKVTATTCRNPQRTRDKPLKSGRTVQHYDRRD